jgi:hypothetical protein
MHSLAHFAASIVSFLLLPNEVIGQTAPLFDGLVALFILDRVKVPLWPSFLVLMQATPEKLLRQDSTIRDQGIFNQFDKKDE